MPKGLYCCDVIVMACKQIRKDSPSRCACIITSALHVHQGMLWDALCSSKQFLRREPRGMLGFSAAWQTLVGER